MEIRSILPVVAVLMASCDRSPLPGEPLPPPLPCIWDTSSSVLSVYSNVENVDPYAFPTLEPVSSQDPASLQEVPFDQASFQLDLSGSRTAEYEIARVRRALEEACCPNEPVSSQKPVSPEPVSFNDILKAEMALCSPKSRSMVCDRDSRDLMDCSFWSAERFFDFCLLNTEKRLREKRLRVDPVL